MDSPEETVPVHRRDRRHARSVNMAGFRRDDGLWEVEGELIDSKPHPWPSPEKGVMPAGAPVHHMLARIVIDSNYQVIDVEAMMKSHPFPECPGALLNLNQLKGCSMSAGWRRTVNTVLADTRGCTHIRELLVNMGTVAYQTIAGEAGTAQGPEAPPHLGRCTAWDTAGAVTLRHMPQFFTTAKR